MLAVRADSVGDARTGRRRYKASTVDPRCRGAQILTHHETISADLIFASIRLVVHEAGGYWTKVSAFPGLHAESETIDGLRREAEASLAGYFESRERQKNHRWWLQISL